MNNTTHKPGFATLIALLDEREQAKTTYDPEANPFANMSLEDVTGRQEHPALNMAAKAPDNPLAYDMEVARFEAAQAGKIDRSAKRMAQSRARADRKADFDKIAKSRKPVRQDRMDAAWLVVAPMVGIIHTAAKSKQRWANRLLGAATQDIPSIATEAMAMALARSDRDLDILRIAALELKTFHDNTNQMPGNQSTEELSADEKRERKEVRKARKWLMGLVNNRVMDAMVESFQSDEHLRWDNIDLIASVAATINGPGDDPMTARFKADRAPAFLGTRFQSPGGIDPHLLAMSINAAITDRRLDPLVEFLLNDEHRRVDGYVEWSKHAKDIFMLTPGGDGDWLWDAVKKSTTHLKNPRPERGRLARKHVQNLFSWMPSVIVATVEAFDQQRRGFSVRHDGCHAILSSDFEAYLSNPVDINELRPHRDGYVPALQYATTRDAANALYEHLTHLYNGTEMLAREGQ